MSANGWKPTMGHEKPEHPANPGERVNILLVDDQPAKLLSYEVILADLGANLIKASSGTEALEYLLKNDIAVVLADVSMPGIDGFELADMIREHPRFQKTAILFISAIHLSDMDRIKGYQRGAVDYISVPVIPEVLRAKVGVFAELHRNRRQLEALNRELEQRVAERTEELQERADLLELATDAIMVRDMEGIVRFWNSGAEALYGWRRGDIVGRELHKIRQRNFPFHSMPFKPRSSRRDVGTATSSSAPATAANLRSPPVKLSRMIRRARPAWSSKSAATLRNEFTLKKLCAMPRSWPPWDAWRGSSRTKSTIRWKRF